MAIGEGTSVLPNDAGITPNYLHGLMDNATLASGAYWQWRSSAAGDGLAAKFVAGVGLYGYNGATVDRLRSYGTGILAMVKKPIADAGAGATQYKNWGAATKASIKGSAGNVWSLAVYNANAAVRYVQLHNKATVPLATEVPLLSHPVPAGTANNPGVLILTESHLQGLRFGTGIGFAVSTTIGTFTDSATAAEHSIEVMYA